mgnify:CR=1 FL=1
MLQILTGKPVRREALFLILKMDLHAGSARSEAMMKLTVKCFATLMPLTPPDGSLEFHGTDVCDLLRQLSIPESEARIIL